MSGLLVSDEENINLFLSFSGVVCLDRVIEVRCGQQTKNFVKFPYTEVESQSFSLMFEKQQGLCTAIKLGTKQCIKFNKYLKTQIKSETKS